MKHGKKVGITVGAFDLCHAGHMMMFEEARSVCDYLIVALHSNPKLDRPDTKNKPVMTVEERLEILKAVRYIDEVIVYDTEADLLKILHENKHDIDIRILGIEYKGKQFTGYDAPLEVHFNSRDHGYSTTELRNRIYEAEKTKRAE